MVGDRRGRASPPVRRSSTTGRRCARASSTAWASSRRATATSATATGIERGEVEAVFAHADIVVEGEYTFPAVYQYAMETHTVIAQVEGDEITLWATCQHPFLVRAEIAALFGVPLAKVRIIVPYLGGGFGSKSYTKMEPITVALARKAGRPVRIQNRVGESMVTTRRHNMTCRMRTAATTDGPPARARRRVPGSTPAPTPTTGRA